MSATGQLRTVARTAAASTAIAAGGLAVVTMAPHAIAESGPAGPLQPVIDQLLDAQRQVADTNSAYPFITAPDLALLPGSTQNLSLTMLAMLLSQLSFDQFHDTVLPWAPYPWSAPATDAQPFLVLTNPDDQYSLVPVDPNQTYLVTVNPGPGSQDVTFTPNAGSVTAGFTPLPGGLDLASATPNPDGSYTIVLSSTPQPGNWVDTAEASRVLIRDTIGDWGKIHDSFTISEQGGTATLTLPLLSEDQISSTLGTVAQNMSTLNASATYLGQPQAARALADNTFTPIQETAKNIPGITLPGQLSSVGHFALEPGQALILKVPDVDAGCSGIQLANAWGETAPYATVQGSLNNTQAFHDPDGFTYYVISGQDPGVANWVDDSGLADGIVFLRWQNVTGPVPATPIQAEVVNVADVRAALPAGTPVVTPAERAVDLQNRLFDYDYVQHQSYGSAWLGANLEYDQVKAAMGADQFDEIFGGQQQVPSLLDRLTPALSPDPFTIAHDILTNPAGSLTAVVDNLPLAIKDIELPVLLAVLRLQALAEQPDGVPGIGSVIDNTFTDPTTSITAGVLNARDDLAVAVMNAGTGLEPLSGSTPLWDSLVELNQSVAAQLVDLLS